MTTFTRALDLTLRFEGEYSAHPDDPGGETKYGISQRAYPHLDIKNLTKEQAAEIYHRDYWLPARCDELPEQVAIAHFDCAVNCGVQAAARILQRALNVKDDGDIGPVTLAAVRAADPARLVERMLLERVAYYSDIALRRSQLRTFLAGWLSRTVTLYRTLT